MTFSAAHSPSLRACKDLSTSLLSRSLQHLLAVTGAGLMYGTSANNMG